MEGLIWFVVITSFLLCSSVAASDGPFLVAHKKASLSFRPQRLFVTIDIYNQGSSSAYDVNLTDDSWPNDAFNVISGSTSKSWRKIDAGDMLSHKFELETKVKGLFSGAPAVIKFRVPTKADLQEALSTPILPFHVADVPSVIPLELISVAKKLVGEYWCLMLVVSIVVTFVYLLITPSKSRGKASKTKRR